MAERLASSRFVAQTRAASRSEEPPQASLGSRVLAYIIDSLLLFGFGMAFISAGLINLFISSNSGLEDPSNAAIRNFVLVLLALPPAWIGLNLLLAVRRGQSLGQYIFGLRVESADGAPLTARRLLLRSFALHPLTFHPLLSGFWFSLGLVSVSLVGSQVVYLSSLMLAFLCLAAPLVSFSFAIGDPKRRGLHDWLSGTKVVRLE